MTQAELDALKALAEAATPTNRLERDGYHIYYRADDGELWQHASFVGGGSADAIYYMAARAAVPALIAEVERLQAAWSAEHDAYIRADEQARMAKRDADELRGEVRELQNRLSAADPDIVWID